MAGSNNDNSFALLIGVGKRGQDNENMRISANDAENIQRVVTAVLEFPQTNVIPKINKEATTTAVLQALDDLARNTAQKPAELVIVYFSGHGCARGDKYYLICNDTKNEEIEIEGKAIKGSIFVDKLNKIKTEKMIVLLDCCHSQGIADHPRQMIPFEKKELISRQDRVIITACGREQVSYLCEPVSLFTYAVIEGLLGHCFTKGDSDVKIFQLALYIRERTATLSAQVLSGMARQEAQLEVLPESRTANFIVTSYSNGQAIPMPSDLAELHKIGDRKDIIKTDVANVRDDGFRNQFNWLSNNNIRIDGNGNITVIGSNITINANTSYDELKELIKTQSELIKQLMQALAGKTDQKIKTVHDKIEISEIENLVESGDEGNIGVALDESLKRVPRGSRTYNFLVPLIMRHKLYEKEKLSGYNVQGRLAEIVVQLLNIIDDYKKTL